MNVHFSLVLLKCLVKHKCKHARTEAQAMNKKRIEKLPTCVCVCVCVRIHVRICQQHKKNVKISFAGKN